MEKKIGRGSPATELDTTAEIAWLIALRCVHTEAFRIA
jgi:hypothetical protein